ncbi:MAG: UDP-N-acetylmuramate--L-alanine ligase [Bacillota bacterium]|nr:UDP-N-acetylmuramate--L-alanine ligase [Bacillota bacterium]
MRYHFVGIGGQGMNPIAQFLKVQGDHVSGSDRYYDRKQHIDLFQHLYNMGIKLFPQNGEAFVERIDKVVISSAIESDNMDVMEANKAQIPIIKRAELLAEIFNNSKGIAIGGTSGKTSVTGMVATVLQEAGLSPTAFIGGELIEKYQEEYTGNLLIGQSDIICIEADESDGSIIHYKPHIGIITNISKDHHEVNHLLSLFQQFVNNIRHTLIINGRCPNCAKLEIPEYLNVIRFGLEEGCDIDAKNIICNAGGMEFSVAGEKFTVKQLGKHNIENALAATAVGMVFKKKLPDIAKGLSKYKGIKRRLEHIGTTKGVAFYDDYAHNPSKIKASINSLQQLYQRLVVVHQCHGFQPTKFMWNDLVETFVTNCREDDVIVLTKIFDAGGSAIRNISAESMVAELKNKGLKSFYLPERAEIQQFVTGFIQAGDAVIVMGARDESLSKLVMDMQKSY